MEIREATKKDFEELMLFYIRMNEVINRRTDKYDPDNAVFPSKEMVENAIRDVQQFVGIEDDTIVSACIANSDCDPAYFGKNWQVDAGNDEFWVFHALRVLPEYEGRGNAKQMIRFLMELASERGIKAIRVDVLEGYSVEKMYLSLGFKYIDTIDILYEDIGYPQRFRLLEKVL